MRLTQSERGIYGSALSNVEQHGSEEQRHEVTHIREQLALHGSYADACSKIEQYVDEIRQTGAPHVPMRFPIRLTQKTRESVENGVFRSFLRFVEDLHGVVVEQHEGEGGWGGVDDSATDVNTALMRVANVLTLESCRVLDRAAMVQQARDVCVSYIERCRQDVVHAECAGLRTLASACNVVIDCLRRFSKESTRIGKGNVVDRMRAFLKTAQRKGLSAAAARMAKARQMRSIMETHGWLHGGRFDDARVARVHALLVLTHDDLSHTLLWHCRRISWLCATSAANRCWCGLSVGEASAEGALLQAPAHLRVFAGEGRLRVAPERTEEPFVCYLSVVSVANVVMDLLRDRKLPLNRISASYANRVLNFDFCKYERAAQNILCDTLQPWLEKVHADGFQ